MATESKTDNGGDEPIGNWVIAAVALVALLLVILVARTQGSEWQGMLFVGLILFHRTFTIILAYRDDDKLTAITPASARSSESRS